MVEEDFGGESGREELLVNIRRLTIAVLDNREEGSRDRTLDQGHKRLLSSTGSKLLRLWRCTMKDDAVSQGAGQGRKMSLACEESICNVASQSWQWCTS